jgi:hypothetical protein
VRDIPREELVGTRQQEADMPSTNNPIPAQLAVVAWPDPVVDALGFPPHDPYSELTGREVRFI